MEGDSRSVENQQRVCRILFCNPGLPEASLFEHMTVSGT